MGPPTKVAWVGEDGSIDECELSSDVDLDVVEPLTEEMDGVNWDVTPESPWRYFQSTGMQLYEKKLDVIVAEENARLGKEWIEAIEERKMQKKMNEKKGYEEWEDWIEFDRDLQA